ncbi:MAG: hypothetical protein FD150_1378 [Rhodobacteraceae bacterium]|nr:MAG: hypothetical protein FD150_1378 [Paracoccaceae bacterium]
MLTWQCVLIAWGDRYPVAEINTLVASITRHSRGLHRIVLLSDGPRPGLAREVTLRPMPEWFLSEPFRGPGCQAKLCMFEAGVLPDDMPAIFLDLDTMVLGDLSRLLQVMETPQSIALLQSAILPFGPLGRLVYRISNGRHYARGNSSVVVFHPAHATFVASRFRALHAQLGQKGFKPLVADERFISWVAQPVMRAVPTSLVVKFPTEYMQPWRWLVHLRAGLPWIRRRRDALVAVTFPGVKLKGEDLAALPEGSVFTDRKGRKLFWTDRALGSLRRRIIAQYAPSSE